MRRLALHLRLAVMLALAAALGALWAPSASAQDDDTFELPITKLDCETDPGAVDPLTLGMEGLPEGCTYAVGVSFTVAAADGTTLGSCTTPAGPPPTCYVTVPVPSTVTVTEDVSTSALGFAPRENPITVSVEPATEASALFVNLPVELPETGTGSEGVSTGRGTMVLLFGGLSLLLAAAGVIGRRQATHTPASAPVRRRR